MTATIDSPVTQLLNQHNIAFNIIEIPLSEDKKPIRNLEALLESEGLDPTSVVRSLLFRTGSGDFVLLAVAGSGRADWATLRKHLEVRKMTMAEFDDIEQETGYVMGAVPPIALPETLRVLIDNSVEGYENIVIGSGVLGYALALRSDDLKEVMSNADHGQFVKE